MTLKKTKPQNVPVMNEMPSKELGIGEKIKLSRLDSKFPKYSNTLLISYKFIKKYPNDEPMFHR
jgi:hypothetical protein